MVEKENKQQTWEMPYVILLATAGHSSRVCDLQKVHGVRYNDLREGGHFPHVALVTEARVSALLPLSSATVHFTLMCQTGNCLQYIIEQGPRCSAVTDS